MTRDPRPPGSSWRSAPLPRNWRALRTEVLRRDEGRCTWFPGSEPTGLDYRECYSNPYRCTDRATDVDHILSPTDHRIEWMRSLCKRHHDAKAATPPGRKNRTTRRSGHNMFELRHPGELR